MNSDLQYWAGVFDFAGSIRWRKTKRGTTPLISLGSKNVALLKQCRGFFAGGIRDDKKYHRWEATGTTARNIIRRLEPVLRVKPDSGLLTWQPNRRGPKRGFPRARFVSFEEKT